MFLSSNELPKWLVSWSEAWTKNIVLCWRIWCSHSICLSFVVQSKIVVHFWLKLPPYYIRCIGKCSSSVYCCRVHQPGAHCPPVAVGFKFLFEWCCFKTDHIKNGLWLWTFFNWYSVKYFMFGFSVPGVLFSKSLELIATQIFRQS